MQSKVALFAREYRPLKRPRLGVPDFYPQDDKQREDELSFHTLNFGYRLPLLVNTQDEYGTALKDFNQALLNPKEYSHRVNQVVEEKKKRRWVQDSDRRRVQITKDNFVAVPLGRSRKEIATQWFQDLASNKPLSVLAKKVPVFNKKEEIFDNLCEKDVPISRATWYIKMAAAHSTTMTDVKLNKKKLSTDPSYGLATGKQQHVLSHKGQKWMKWKDWTVSLTKYMQECVWRISNEPMPTPRQEAMAGSVGGRHSSASGSQAQAPSEEGMAEHIRWQYMVYLSSWLYQENLLDCHEFLRWLVERVEHIKATDTKGLQLYLPLVLKHLLDLASCVALARPLVKNCCQRLSSLFELEQRLAKLQPHSAAAPSSLPLKPLAEDSGQMDDDSVFDSTTVSIKQEPGVHIKAEPLSNAGTPVAGPGGPTKTPGGSKKRSSLSSISKDRKHTAGTPSTLNDGEVPIITMKAEDDDMMTPVAHSGAATAAAEGAGHVPGPFHWCTHHQALMLQLCSVIQTVSLRCPTAFVQTKVFVGRGVQGGKPTLSLLPVGLTELLMPRSLSVELQKKLVSALASAEQEITMRNKAVDSDWSAVAVADLQTTSEGSNVQQVLKLLEVLDTHSFTKCHAYNPLTTLYHRISAEQRGVEHPLTNEMFAMLLCQWAVTPRRSGKHRPLVAARILRQRQDQMMRGGDWKEDRDKASMDETWEDFEETTYTGISDVPFPFQTVLVKFLDQRAPLPDDLSSPVKPGEPFYHLVLLYCELVRLSVFSYTAYLSTLIARGEIKQAILPFLPFAQEEVAGLDEISRKRPAPQDQELHLSIPLPALKQPHLDIPGSGAPGGAHHPLERGSQSNLSGIASGPPSPGSSFSTGMGNFMDLLSGGDPTTSSANSMFPNDMEVSEIQKRAQQLQMLTSETSNLDSPIDFSSGTQDISSPSHTQTKGDHFNFSLSTFFMEEEHLTDPTLDKHASRHLIYAAYFPVNCYGFGRQEKNERAVVLCGVGRVRQRVESIVRQISSDIQHCFRQLTGIQKPALFGPKIRFAMLRFRSLPSFEQHIIATSCNDILRESLSRKTPYPACSKLVFVCELLETCGALHQLMSLLVDIIACDFPLAPGPKGDHRRGPPPPPCLPSELCLPVLCMLHNYLPCLLLSQLDTTVVFENLCRVMDGVQTAEVSPSQKGVFQFLHSLYTNCSYLQNTFRSRFGHLCMQLGDSLLVETYAPLTTEISEWQKILQTKPSEVNVPKLCMQLKQLPHQSKILGSFAIDVFSTACMKGVTCETLCDLARVCAGVSSSCGAKVNRELMGAFRALCVPSQVLKSSHAGYSSLTSRTNVPKDRDIHSSLISFVALLLASNCFLLSDIVIYIIRPVIRFFNSSNSSPLAAAALEFANSLILHLFVDAYRRGDGMSGGAEGSKVTIPLFVQHSLRAQCRKLPLGYVMMILKDLVRISAQKAESVLMHSSVARHDFVLGELRKTLELLCTEQWVRTQCSQHSARLLDSDMLGEKLLTSTQARHLLLLCCPYSASTSPEDLAKLAKSDSSDLLEDILKNLDQWTLSNSLLHINASIAHALGTTRAALLEELAAQVIRVFEDSCGDEWLGQTIESCVEGGDGSFSPSVWLVTPLISKLQESVLGRVLKSAGNVLGQGQWWNPEKNQEKRRSTRATSGVTTPKTGLQWQQPFLELVLACMHAQSTTHEELLAPLKSQLSNFLAAFDKEGMPNDEHGKAMLFAALKLRLSLVGSMLASICASESSTLDWLHLLMQFICSGAIDRQTDTSELFTNCLDMISTLLGSLSSEFHFTLAGGGEEGKKVHTGCIKKIKAELSNSKSYCASEIRQLFPLSPKMYTVTTVKPPPSIALTKGAMANDRIKGLRVQDVKEISPWEILEGVKNSGPLMLSWFGAVRMKRKPLWFEEQRHLVRFHTHQNQSQNFISGPHTVKLPSEEAIPPIPVNQTSTEISKTLSDTDPAQGDAPKPGAVPGAAAATSGVAGGGVAGSGGQMPMQTHTVGPQQGQVGAAGGGGGQMMESVGVSMSSTSRQGMNPLHSQMMAQQYRQGQMRQAAMQERTMYMNAPSQQALMKHRLNEIYEQQMRNSTGGTIPSMYPPNIAMMGPGGVAATNPNYRRIQVMQQRHQMQQQNYLRMLRQQQLQQQQQQIVGQQYAPGGAYRGGPPHAPPHMMPGGMPGGGMHPQVQPMQANPPMQMHQVMQQRQQAGYPQPSAMGAPPHPGMAPGQPYQGPPPGMNQGMHRPGMF